MPAFPQPVFPQLAAGVGGLSPSSVYKKVFAPVPDEMMPALMAQQGFGKKGKKGKGKGKSATGKGKGKSSGWGGKGGAQPGAQPSEVTLGDFLKIEKKKKGKTQSAVGGATAAEAGATTDKNESPVKKEVEQPPVEMETADVVAFADQPPVALAAETAAETAVEPTQPQDAAAPPPPTTATVLPGTEMTIPAGMSMPTGDVTMSMSPVVVPVGAPGADGSPPPMAPMWDPMTGGVYQFVDASNWIPLPMLHTGAPFYTMGFAPPARGKGKGTRRGGKSKGKGKGKADKSAWVKAHIVAPPKDGEPSEDEESEEETDAPSNETGVSAPGKERKARTKTVNPRPRETEPEEVTKKRNEEVLKWKQKPSYLRYLQIQKHFQDTTKGVFPDDAPMIPSTPRFDDMGTSKRKWKWSIEEWRRARLAFVEWFDGAADDSANANEEAVADVEDKTKK
eukprot:g13562.t1